MNEINGHQYTDLGYSHEELKELLAKINKGKVLTPAQHDMLINTIKIENISTFSGNYDDLVNTPDIPKIVNDIIRTLNLASNDAVGTSLEAIKNDFDNNIKTLNKQKANVEHTHTTGDVIGIDDMLNGKADIDHYHDVENIMGLNNLINALIKDKADTNHTHTDFYTKSEVDEIVNEAIADGEIDLSDYVTDDQLQDYATKESIKNLVTLQELLDKLAAYVTLEKLAEEMKKLPVEDHTHQDILDQLNNKADVDNVYNKDEIDDMLKNIDLEGGVDTEHNHDDLLSKEEAENTYAKIDDSEAMIEMIGLLEEDIEQHKTDSNNAINSIQTNLTNKINMAQEDLENQIGNLSTEINVKLDNKADKFHSHDTYYSKSEIDNKLAQLSGGGSIDLEGYLKQEDVLPLQEDIDKLQQDVANKADANHIHNYKVSDIEGLQEALDSKANTDDSVEIPDDIMTIINNKADKNHTHDYAPLEHSHNYANVDHEHEEIINLQNELDNKANKEEILSEDDVVNIIKDNVGDIGSLIDPEHNHDDRYALLEHSHEEYALEKHEHDYAATDHLHNNYADVEHNHNTDYSKKDHTHTEFAKTNHDHDYAPTVHTHDYASTTHDHDDNYAQKTHIHRIDDITNLQTTLDKKLETGMVYTKEEVDKKLVDISSGGTIDLEGFIKQSDLAAGLATKADVTHTHLIDEIDDLQKMLDKKGNAVDMATKTELNQGLAVKADTTHSHTIDEVDDLQDTINHIQDNLDLKANVSDTATKKELSDGLASKAADDHVHEIYAIKEHEHENYYSKTETEEVINDLLESKTTELIATANIYTDTAISELTKDAPADLNSFADVASKITEQNTIIESVRNDVSDAMGNVAPADHTHSEYATIESENEREIFTTTELTVSTLGGIQAGSDLNGLTVKEILNKLLYPYVAPTISVSGTPNGGIFEKGDNQTITNVKAVITKKSEKITKIEIVQGSTVLAMKDDTSIADGGTFNFTVNVPVNSANVQLTGKVTDAQGSVRTSTTAAFNFVYPYYVGVCGENDIINETLIKGLTKRIEAKGTKAISYTTNQQKMIIAYPKSYGVIRKVLDANSFDVTNTFTKTEIKITGLDGTSQSYYVYVNNASTVDGFTMTFSY